MNPDELLYEVQARLSESGLLIVARGDAVTLTWRGASAKLHVELHPRLTLTVAESSLGDPQTTLFVSEYINAKTADALRRRGFQFVDAAGNVHLLNEHWLVDIQGRKSAPRVPTERYSSENMFSPRRAQVVFALLTWPELIEAPLRDLSGASGVSLGLAHATFFALKENYRMWPAHPEGRERLIDAWAASFPLGLAPSLNLRQFRAENVDMFFGLGIEVSGEAAHSSGLRPQRATIYVAELDDDLIMSNRWRADGAHNVTVRRKFWRAPWGGADPDAPKDAPPLIVYGDLISSDDPRSHEAAAALRRQL